MSSIKHLMQAIFCVQISVIQGMVKSPRGSFFVGGNMATDKDTKEIVKAIKELTKELKAIRKLMKEWDDDPPIDEADPDKYIA